MCVFGFFESVKSVEARPVWLFGMRSRTSGQSRSFVGTRVSFSAFCGKSLMGADGGLALGGALSHHRVGRVVVDQPLSLNVGF